MRRSIQSRLTLGLAALVAIAAATPALACGGFFCNRVMIDQAGEKIFFAQDGSDVVAHVQITYMGDPHQFAWILPVPSQPKLGVGSDAFFTALRNATKPQFNLNITNQGECGLASNRAVPQAAGAAATAPSGVTVVSQAQVGPYDSAIIQSNDPGALKSWLTTNGYDIPDNVDTMLDPYIAGKYYFVALKLQNDRTDGDLQPITLRYQATKPGIPIRLTAIAATPNMGVYVWLLGKARAIPENYKHTVINEALIDWLNNGTNYQTTVVPAAVKEAGGQAWVTDYAGDASAVSLSGFDPSQYDTDVLTGLANDPASFVTDVMNGHFFANAAQNVPTPGFGAAIAMPFSLPAPELSFLKRYVPKPAALANVDDTVFYQNISQYKTQLSAANETVDTAKAIQELQDTIVQPAKDIQALFGQDNYLTQLYTTMSPADMTQDPTFLYNPDLPKVSNIHTATGVRECNKNTDFFDAPVKITLSNGLTYTVSNGGTGNGTPIAMPAAARIEQLTTSGAPAVIQDNRAAIVKALSDAGATDQGGNKTAVSVGSGGTVVAMPQPSSSPHFGCFGFGLAPSTVPPFRQGAGEGATYALLLLGFWGYRRYRR